MTAKQLLSLTLLATALTLNAGQTQERSETTQQKENSLSSTLANILQGRGIEKSAAYEMTQNFTTKNEALFTLMLNNLLVDPLFSKERVLEYLSTMALQKKSIDFASYSSLVKLTQTIKNSALEKQTLKSLEQIAEKNLALKRVFA